MKPFNTDDAKAYPEKLQRIKYYDLEKQKRILKNAFMAASLSMAQSGNEI
jgi:hypothetical protein